MDSETDQDAKVSKCIRFFKTLLNLSKKKTEEDLKDQVEGAPITSPTKFEVIRQLDLIYGDLLPENFTINLQKTLNSKTQDNLVPFISSTLPEIKSVLRSGMQTLEGIGSFEEYEAERNALINSNENSGLVNQVDSLAALDASIDGVINSAVASVSSHSSNPSTSYSLTTTNYYPSQTNIPESSNQILAPLNPMSTVAQNLNNETISGSIEYSNASIGILAPPLGSLPLEAPQNNQQISIPSESFVNRNDITFDDHLNYNCILNFQALASKIHATMPESEVVDYDVLIMISNAVEAKLRRLISNLASVAEHRLEPLRLNPAYKQLDDPRKQLRFMENIERHAFERHENLEKEAIMKLSKSKGKDKDAMEPDKEAAMNRDANAAAIAALGTSKGVKRTAPGGTSNNNFAFSNQVNFF